MQAQRKDGCLFASIAVQRSKDELDTIQRNEHTKALR